MKKRKVWRYTCDHCGKSNCSSWAMKQHELRCFKNPQRKCPVCGAKWPRGELAAPMAALADIEESTEGALIRAIESAADGCPACTLAAIIQGPLPMVEWDIPGEFHFGEFHEGTHGEYRYRVKWDYKTARDEYRRDQMDDIGLRGF